MKRADLLAALNDVRAQLRAVTAGLEPAQLEAPGVVGDWSVKDVLAHLTACEVDMLTRVGKARRGLTPRPPPKTSAAIDAQNARWAAEMRARPLDRVLADLDGARQQTVRLVETLNEADLAAAPKWLGMSLAEYIGGDTCEHEAEHVAQLRAWRQSSGP